MNNLYKNKYLKYKQKYLELKGGAAGKKTNDDYDYDNDNDKLNKLVGSEQSYAHNSAAHITDTSTQGSSKENKNIEEIPVMITEENYNTLHDDKNKYSRVNVIIHQKSSSNTHVVRYLLNNISKQQFDNLVISNTDVYSKVKVTFQQKSEERYLLNNISKQEFDNLLISNTGLYECSGYVLKPVSISQ